MSSTPVPSAYPFDHEVAIVGLGPVGGVLANILGSQGIDTVVLDRSLTAPDLPRGVGIDAEMMRVVQGVDLAETLEPFLKVFRGAQYLDIEGNVVSTRPGIDGPGPQGWPARYNVHQPDFENVLREGMLRFDALTLALGHEVDAVEHVTVDGVAGGAVTSTELATGRPQRVTARYVVGCDGARSIVRKSAGVRLDDFGLNEPWIVVDFEVNETADVPGINTHFADPVTPVIYIHVVRNLRRFEFRAQPGEDLEAAVETDAIWQRVSRWLTPDQATLVRAAVYTHRSLVAENWRDGALIVAGDAAHQTPPFTGQGLCAGVRDVASLGWRLPAVLRGGAPDSLLDGYGEERSDHARFVIQTATSFSGVLTSPDKKTIDSLNARIGREGQGRPPRLGPGLWRAGDENSVAGTLAPQPRLADGTLLDDVVGARFALVATAGCLADLAASTRERAEQAGIVLVEATGEATGWLEDLGAGAALVRPDRYYVDTCTDAADVAAAVELVAQALAPQPVGATA